MIKQILAEFEKEFADNLYPSQEDNIKEWIEKTIHRIAEELPVEIISEKQTHCDCEDLPNCKWTKGYNSAKGDAEYYVKQFKQSLIS